MDTVIQLLEVTKSYPACTAPALQHLSLEVAAGEAIAVMGPSGSGKSTLLNLIAGLDKPTTGTVTVASQRVDALTETAAARFRRSQLGMIFQFFNLLDDLSVRDNVMLPARLAGLSRRSALARAAELLTAVGMHQFRDTYPGRLSGGQQQRVAIARALVNRPAVLLADEPTGALDTGSAEGIGQLLADLNAAGQTLVLVTHNPDLACRYASRVVALLDGQIAGDAPSGAAGRPGAGARP
jgi:putative ABC transport system ATP-binding protein